MAVGLPRKKKPPSLAASVAAANRQQRPSNEFQISEEELVLNIMRLPFISGLALTLCGVATANIIPTSTTITGSGPFTWTYDLRLSADQNVNSGVAPTSNPVPHTNVDFSGFLTVYDFAGYITGSCAGPSGWTCTAQNIGFTPDDVSPTDNSNIVNVTWAYTTGPTLLGQPAGLDLGIFSARSIYGRPTQVSYASRGIANAGPQAGTIADNIGSTQGPSGVPEPASMALIGTGLIGFAWLARRVRKFRIA
jgi:PEP-CTERM motif